MKQFQQQLQKQASDFQAEKEEMMEAMAQELEDLENSKSQAISNSKKELLQSQEQQRR